jgi:ABC-type sugar transport system substrate-binding protein
MKKRIGLFISALFLVLVLWTGVFPQNKIKIAIVPKSNTAIFWKSIHSGIKLGAVALGGVDVLWRAPSKDDDLAQQISIVDQCTCHPGSSTDGLL